MSSKNVQKTAFERNLVIFRDKKNLRQEDVAKELEVKKQAVSNYENGRSWVSRENLYKLADLYEVPVWRLFYDALDENLTLVSEDSTRLKARLHDARDKIDELENKIRRQEADLTRVRTSEQEFKKEAERLRKEIFALRANVKVKH